jgi:hypothetical protein
MTTVRVVMLNPPGQGRNILCPNAPAVNDPDGITCVDQSGTTVDFKRLALKYFEIDNPSPAPITTVQVTLHYTNGISEAFGVTEMPDDRASWVKIVTPGAGPIRYYNGDLVAGMDAIAL